MRSTFGRWFWSSSVVRAGGSTPQEVLTENENGPAPSMEPGRSTFPLHSDQFFRNGFVTTFIATIPNMSGLFSNRRIEYGCHCSP